MMLNIAMATKMYQVRHIHHHQFHHAMLLGVMECVLCGAMKTHHHRIHVKTAHNVKP
jgi:hypothetical protein